MMILVQSKITNSAVRKRIRETWKHECEASHFCSCIFVTGRSHKSKPNERLKEEAEKFQDIVQVDIEEAYNNLTLKTIFSIQ